MSTIEIIVICAIHWFGDFMIQTHWQASNKSKSIKALLLHTIGYSLCWFILWPILREDVFKFVGITFVAHTTTDFFTSKINAKLWKENRVHDFFVSVGCDQLWHYIQLFLTYTYLIM